MSEPGEVRTWLDELAERPLDWGAWILRPATKRYVFPGGGITAAPGLYALYVASGELLYIGRAASISDRLRTHARRTNFFEGEPVSASCCIVENETIRRHAEMAHLYALQPPENIRYEGATWSGHAAMVFAIRRVWGRSE